jgi:hypothetical protein
VSVAPVPALKLVTDSGKTHNEQRLEAELAKFKRLFQAAQDELFAEKDARQKYYEENKRLKQQLIKQTSMQAEDELVSAVFEFWKVMCSSNRAKLGPARVKKVQERLRDRPPTMPAEFFRAIVGAAHDPFVKDGKIFNDLELVCRNESKFEAFVQRFYEVPDVRRFIDETGGDDARRAATALMDLDRRQKRGERT